MPGIGLCVGFRTEWLRGMELQGIGAAHPACLTGTKPCAKLSVAVGARTGLPVGLCVSVRLGGLTMGTAKGLCLAPVICRRR